MRAAPDFQEQPFFGLTTPIATVNSEQDIEFCFTAVAHVDVRGFPFLQNIATSKPPVRGEQQSAIRRFNQGPAQLILHH